MTRAALYLRSSKDRHDVSIDAQRAKLQELAAARDLTVIAEYTDVVESAASIDRAGFQQMLHDLRKPGSVRKWSAILILDTSRLGRRRWMGPVFRHEAKRRGVEVIYNTMPDVDPISRLVLESVLEAMDEIHSVMSRDKGIAGQVENVKRGYRAGGRAPIGYKLRKVGTGKMRDGQEVSKTTLVPDSQAPVVKRYLKMRAAGTSRRKALRDTGVQISQSGAVSLDWHALTYAGHSVYGMYAEHYGGEKKQASKRRARGEWLIQRDTHPALITEKEALTIIERLESSKVGQAIREAKAMGSQYLLTGLLYSPDGRMWTGTNAKTYPAPRYRLKAAAGKPGRYFPCDDVDTAVMDRLSEDLASQKFVLDLIESARQHYDGTDDALDTARKAMADLDRRISRMMELAEDLRDPAPALRKVDELEATRPALAAEVERLEEERACRKTVQALSEGDVRSLLHDRLSELREASARELKPALRDLLGRIVLCPTSGQCQIQYRIQPQRSLNVASPRGRVQWTLEGQSNVAPVRVAGGRK